MKKLLFILLCLPMIGFGQFLYKLDSITAQYSSFSFPETLFHKFEYDNLGKLTKLEYPNPGDSTRNFADSNGITFYSYNSRSLLFEYNTNDQIIKIYTCLLNTNLNIDTASIVSIIYDSNGNLVERVPLLTSLGQNINQNSANETISDSKKEYSYNSSNQHILTESFEWNGFSYILDSKHYFYWNSNLPDSSVHFYNSSDWSDISNVKYYSCNLDNIISIMQVSYDGPSPSNSYYDTSFVNYNHDNNILSNTSAPNTSIFNGFVFGVDVLYSQKNIVLNVEYPPFFSYSWHYYYSNFTSTSVLEYKNNRKIFKVIDLLGRETKDKKNEPLLYIYDDGTVEKRIVID